MTFGGKIKIKMVTADMSSSALVENTMMMIPLVVELL